MQSLFQFRRSQNIDVPTSQTRSKSHVLSTTADCQRQLIIANDDRRSSEFEAQTDFFNFSRLERVGDQHLAGFIPTNDVDLLAAEFVNNISNARTTNAHACTDSIDLCIHRRNRQFRAESRFARHRLDFDRSLCDFWNFGLKESTNKIGMRTAHHNLDLTACIADIKKNATNSITCLKLLAWNLLTLGHESFGAFQLHNQCIAFVTLRHTCDQFALTLREFIKERNALVFSESLDHHLLESLRWDASQTLQRNHFTSLIFIITPERNPTSEAVDLATKFVGILGIKVFPRGTHHGEFEVLNQEFTINISVTGNGVEQSDDVIHLRGPFELSPRIKKVMIAAVAFMTRPTALGRSINPFGSPTKRSPLPKQNADGRQNAS